MKKRLNGKKRKITFTTAAQTCFLTASLFIRNNLTSFASACAFGFLFSFIPVVMMIFIILIRILHASPEILYSLINFDRLFSNIFSMQSLLGSIRSIGRVGSFEVFIVISIFWMARRFFASVMDGMYKIFHKAAPPRPVLSQILIFGGEVFIVILTASVIFIIISAQAVFSLPLSGTLKNAAPETFSIMVRCLAGWLPYFLALLFITVTYKTASGTKPPVVLCVTAAASCTLTYRAAVKLMNIFIDKNKYDLIYGVLSHLIVLLMEVFVFFILVLLFAEVIYVIQFFDLLLLGELYLLPSIEAKDLLSLFRRKLFIRPDYLMCGDKNIICCKTGQTVFTLSDTTTDVFYIAEGKIRLNRQGTYTFFGRGCFFGEQACIFNKKRDEEATAVCNSQIIRIDGSRFRQLIEQDPRVAAKSLSQISDYFTRIYGRTDSFLL